MSEKATVSREPVDLSHRMLEVQNERIRALQTVRAQVRELTINTIPDLADELFAQVLMFPCKQMTKATYKLVMVGVNHRQYKDPEGRFEKQKKRLLIEVDRLFEKMELTIDDYT